MTGHTGMQNVQGVKEVKWNTHGDKSSNKKSLSGLKYK